MWRKNIPGKAFTKLDFPPTPRLTGRNAEPTAQLRSLDRELHGRLSGDPPAQAGAGHLRGSLFLFWPGITGLERAFYLWPVQIANPRCTPNAWRGLIAWCGEAAMR